MNTGKCPECKETVAVDLRHGPIGGHVSGPMVTGFIAVCPRCETILGVLPGIDDIVRRVAEVVVKERAPQDSSVARDLYWAPGHT